MKFNEQWLREWVSPSVRDNDLSAQLNMGGLEVDAIDPRRYFLMVETGDEVLDYRHAVERYRGAQQLVIKGGDHGFSDFADYLDEVMEFCAAPAG